MNLVIVESPTKARTLSRFLGREYEILASMGHIRDLPKKKFGVDVAHNFSPEYVLIPGKKEAIERLKTAAGKSKQVILATDPDREGEAIAYHVYVVCSNSKFQIPNSKFIRITFHEITKPAIEEALNHPGTINMQLVRAQQARRILDRLVGYKLSPLLWAKVRRGLSAGRVQSVVLRLIVEREREIEKFKKEEFWTIEAELAKNQPGLSAAILLSSSESNPTGLLPAKSPTAYYCRHVACRASSPGAMPRTRAKRVVRGRIVKTHKIGQPRQSFYSSNNHLVSPKNSFLASLYSKDGEKYEKTETIQLFAGPYKYQESRIKNQESCEEIVKDLKNQNFVVEAVEEKEVLRQPPPPFITSTLQQTASRAFGFSGKKTMMLAQKLYEEGYITYHRTDSFALSAQALKQIRKHVKDAFGQDYLAPQVRIYKTRSKLAQEAHEAIRPTNIKLKVKSPAKMAGRHQSKVKNDEERLYDLIWKRSLATQMAAARLSQTSVDIKAGQYLLKATGVRTLFEGFLRLYPQWVKEKLLPKLKEGEKLSLLNVLPKQNFTSPPPRYNEASLVKILEAKGIGRPSTYAPVISLIQQRAYVEKKEGGFWPTTVGEAVNDFLVANFADVVDIPFTSQMEEDLDSIARGEKKWVPVLGQFYTPFEKKIDSVYKKSSRVKIEVEKTGKVCPKCKKGEVVIRTGKFGKFLSCSRFPACDWKADYLEKVPKVLCPKCGAAVVVRRTKKGRQFFGCEKWPKCSWASWRKPKN